VLNNNAVKNAKSVKQNGNHFKKTEINSDSTVNKLNEKAKITLFQTGVPKPTNNSRPK